MMTTNAMAALTLLMTEGVGPTTVRRMAGPGLGQAPSVEGMRERLTQLKQAYSRTRVPSLDALEQGRDAAMWLVERCDALGIAVVALGDAAYPRRLAELYDAPPVLYVKGSVAVLGASAVAVVGTRKPTPYGERAAYALGRRLAEAGVVVVSGLAYGCDVAAHEGCQAAGGLGVVVLAHGLDAVHPAAHRKLAEGLLEDGGCLVSEYAPGVTPRPQQFVARNRLQSGLSQGVVVVETGRVGGTMHTARFARAQGRALGCVKPTSLQEVVPQQQGNVLLIEGGAVALSASELPAWIREVTKASCPAVSASSIGLGPLFEQPVGGAA